MNTVTLVRVLPTDPAEVDLPTTAHAVLQTIICQKKVCGFIKQWTFISLIRHSLQAEPIMPASITVEWRVRGILMRSWNMSDVVDGSWGQFGVAINVISTPPILGLVKPDSCIEVSANDLDSDVVTSSLGGRLPLEVIDEFLLSRNADMADVELNPGPIAIILAVIIVIAVAYYYYDKRRSAYMLTGEEERFFADVVEMADGLIHDDEAPMPSGALFCGRFIRQISLSIKADKGLLEKTPANVLMVRRMVSEKLDEHRKKGLRAAHAAHAFPLVVELVFMPLPGDIAAKKFAASDALISRQQDASASWWSWNAWFGGRKAPGQHF